MTGCSIGLMKCRAIERAVLALARGSLVELEDLPEELRGPPRASLAVTGAATRPLAQVEREYIIAALELHGGNQTRTAQVLEIGVATLYRKLKSYGLINRPRTTLLPAEHLTLLGEPRRERA
jgi:two-component system, NtrC family, response regulator HydG